VSISFAPGPATLAAASPVSPDVTEVSTTSLPRGRSPRARGIDRGHVALLAEVPESWPPIVINRRDGSVIDGQHRVAAARQLGIERLCAVFFEGSPDDAYVEFVRCNVGHGLALTLDERRDAVRRILRTHPELSDRGIASVCGLSPKTVARVRRETGEGRDAGGESVDGTRRVGRDGRQRPVDASAARARIADELERHPDASLRTIATAVGVSPETVRTVREKLRRAPRPPADVVALREPEDLVSAVLARKRHRAAPLEGDRAFTDRDDGRQFVDWFEATCVDDADLWQHGSAVPRSRVYEIADEARRRASVWTRFAEQLEGQVCRRA
jgi:ParB-like chromosome segregation protein Spo0J